MTVPEVVDARGRPVRNVIVGPAWTPRSRRPSRRKRGRMSLGVAIDTEALFDRALTPTARAWLGQLDGQARLRMRMILVDVTARYAWGRLRALRIDVDATGQVVLSSVWEPPRLAWRAP